MIVIIAAKFDIPPQTVNTYTEQVDDLQKGIFVPPNKPPPTLNSHTCTTKSNHHYSRLIRSRPKAGKYRERPMSGSSEISPYYNITSEHDNYDDGIEYYVEFDEEHLDSPYVDESESLVCTDAQYSAESDLYFQQQQQQRKRQSFVRSSSLELESDKEGAHAREAVNTLNATNTVVNSPRCVYQNCTSKSEYDNAKLKPTLKKARRETGSTSYNHEIMGTRELGTEYTNAEILESTTF